MSVLLMEEFEASDLESDFAKKKVNDLSDVVKRYDGRRLRTYKTCFVKGCPFRGVAMRADSLKRHKETCHGDQQKEAREYKLYTCPDCPYETSRKNDFDRHMTPQCRTKKKELKQMEKQKKQEEKQKKKQTEKETP